MIQSVSITNFQSHKKSNLEFCQGVNVIIGKSDSGKSSVLRALNWIINNRPSGDSFRSKWGGKTDVSIITDKNTISRTKDKTKNEYVLSGKTYKAFGQDIPADIKKAINILPINIQYQLDPPFMLSKSPGEVARYLNKIVHIEDADEAMKKIESRKRKVNSDIENNKKELQSTKNELKKFDWIEEAENDFNKIMGLSDCANELIITKEGIEKIINSYLELEAEKIDIDIYEAEEEFNKIVKDINNINSKEKYISDFERDIEEIKRVQDNIFNRKEKLRLLQEQYNKILPDICPLCGSKIKKELK